MSTAQSSSSINPRVREARELPPLATHIPTTPTLPGVEALLSGVRSAQQETSLQASPTTGQHGLLTPLSTHIPTTLTIPGVKALIKSSQRHVKKTTRERKTRSKKNKKLKTLEGLLLAGPYNPKLVAASELNSHNAEKSGLKHTKGVVIDAAIHALENHAIRIRDQDTVIEHQDTVIEHQAREIQRLAQGGIVFSGLADTVAQPFRHAHLRPPES
ncbi:uncharacterized protein BDZ99DRAFT_468567 [Mytilinidion resinicola]|uniref:Uncharacterized protein n=1 Tax=Mytilinidion resinicola TaxID=574789 RepID=A0A6A6Y241_9PEZI|nr:uncharacterized protein BDZ99DRAFT_468567 [Mytilinidion resinicola]KAF2802886.1 hypothetical protein BDZ99DRAFT_468567 [Mytilinidion resinicola]